MKQIQLIAPEDIKLNTRFTCCTRYSWDWTNPQPELKIALGKWYVSKEGWLYKLIAKNSQGNFLALGQAASGAANLDTLVLDSSGGRFSQWYLTMLAPRTSRMDLLKKAIVSSPDWNQKIAILHKAFPKIQWAPCFYAGRGALKTPKENQDD